MYNRISFVKAEMDILFTGDKYRRAIIIVYKYLCNPMNITKVGLRRPLLHQQAIFKCKLTPLRPKKKNKQLTQCQQFLSARERESSLCNSDNNVSMYNLSYHNFLLSKKLCVRTHLQLYDAHIINWNRRLRLISLYCTSKEIMGQLLPANLEKGKLLRFRLTDMVEHDTDRGRHLHK